MTTVRELRERYEAAAAAADAAEAAMSTPDHAAHEAAVARYREAAAVANDAFVSYWSAQSRNMFK